MNKNSRDNKPKSTNDQALNKHDLLSNENEADDMKKQCSSISSIEVKQDSAYSNSLVII
jgi:hypothetical protein